MPCIFSQNLPYPIGPSMSSSPIADPTCLRSPDQHPISSNSQSLSSTSNADPLSMPQRSSETLSSSPNSEVDLDDAVIKAFNSLPKDICKFYAQMKEGDETLKKFTELPDALRGRREHTPSENQFMIMFQRRTVVFHHCNCMTR